MAGDASELPLFARHLATPAPEYLFHYTTPGGLDGILRSNSLWASSLLYLNHAEELRYALQLVRGRLGRRAEAAAIPDQRAFYEYCADNLNRIEGLNACAFSMSANCDQLSQWRAYCPPTGGYSLGLRSDLLAQIARQKELLFGPCAYRPEEQLPLLDEILDWFDSTIREVEGAVAARGPELAEIALPGLFSRLARVAPFIKSDTFEEETEWRLVFVRTPPDEVEVDVRVGNSILVPYAVLRLPEDSHVNPIRRVIVGPCNHPELSMRAVGMLGEVARSQIEQVIRSRVPYRVL